MKFYDFVKSGALATALAVGTVGAASATSFTIDPGVVTVTGPDFCIPGNCQLEGVLNGATFDLNGLGDSETIADLFDWTVLTTSPWATGAGIYSVAVTLTFSAPLPGGSTNAGGIAGFGTLLGTVSGDFLTWTSGSGSLDIGGYTVDYALANGAALGFGNTASTGGTFTLTAVPVPAAGILLLAGLGGLGGLSLRRKKAA